MRAGGRNSNGRPASRPFLFGLALCAGACARPAIDSPEAARARDDAVVETALADEAQRLGLARTGDGPARLAAARREALLEAAARRLDEALPQAAEADVDAFLAANRAAVNQPERLRLRHVFLRIPADVRGETRAARLAELQRIRERILGGEDMAALARARSDSETAKFEGLIAPQARGQLPPAIEAVVWGLAPGELSGVVDTPIGAHLFRLEERLGAEELPAAQQRDWARLRLRVQARERAQAAEQERLLAAAGATLQPEALASTDPQAVALSLPGAPLARGDLMRLREGRGFAAQRTTAPEELLAQEAWTRLLEWDLARGGREGAAAAAARAERTALASLARDRRFRIWRDGLPDSEVRAFYEAHRTRFASRAEQRLRVLAQRLSPGRPIHGIYERLDRLARAIRAGGQDLAVAAQEASDDPSATRGGDLGFVGGIELGLWVGPTTAARIAALPVGELSPPLLIEVYREEKLAYEPQGYLLVRVEERRDPRPQDYEAARERARELLAAERAAEGLARIRADVLSGR